MVSKYFEKVLHPHSLWGQNYFSPPCAEVYLYSLIVNGLVVKASLDDINAYPAARHPVLPLEVFFPEVIH